MSAETLIDRLDALWLEMNDALAEPPAAARILNALHDAAQALRTPPAPTEAVAWRWLPLLKGKKEPWMEGDATPWVYWTGSAKPDFSACPAGDIIDLQPLYTHPPQPDALPGDLRERVAAVLYENIGAAAWSGDAEVHGIPEAADAILSLIQSERGEP